MRRGGAIRLWTSCAFSKGGDIRGQLAGLVGTVVAARFRDLPCEVGCLYIAIVGFRWVIFVHTVLD